MTELDRSLDARTESGSLAGPTEPRPRLLCVNYRPGRWAKAAGVEQRLCLTCDRPEAEHAEHPDADVQSPTVGIVASEEDVHPGGIPCGACVTCACDAAPRVDEEGLCLGCGGVPVACALLFGELHVGPTEELTERARNRIGRLITEELRFQVEGGATILPPGPDERAGWPTAKGWAAKVTSREYVRHGALDETPWRFRLEDDREGTGFLTISEETITSRCPTARPMAIITALDLTEPEALWLRDALTAALSKPREEAL